MSVQDRIARWFAERVTKHDWILIDTQILPSGLEQAAAGVKTCGGKGGFHGLNSYDLVRLSRKVLVQTFKCRLTGDIWVEKTYNI